MNSLNSILIEGNLVRDPEYKETANGTPLCAFSIASNRYYKRETGQEKEVSFIDVQACAKIAENCKNLGRKGRGVRTVGRIKQERWNDKQGKAQSRIIVVAEHVESRPALKREPEEKFAASF